LPTAQLRPDRDFSGQRFVRHVAEQTPWLPWRHSGFEARDTGIDAATSGYASAMSVRANKSATMNENKHQHQLMFMFVLSGSAALNTKNDSEKIQLQAGTSITLPSLFDFTLEITSDNTQLLLVELPA
jgi:mannose-6-phosphate isomerase-like protein (cupin superfamily)